MDITLSSTAEKIVRRKIESGSYHSVDEVIGAALELLQEQEQDWGAKIEQGLAEARAGELLDEDEVKTYMAAQKAAWRAAQIGK